MAIYIIFNFVSAKVKALLSGRRTQMFQLQEWDTLKNNYWNKRSLNIF